MPKDKRLIRFVWTSYLFFQKKKEKPGRNGTEWRNIQDSDGSAEWNAFWDPLGTSELLSLGLDLWLVPLVAGFDATETGSMPSYSLSWGALGRHKCCTGEEGLHPAIGSYEAGGPHRAADLGTVQVPKESLCSKSCRHDETRLGMMKDDWVQYMILYTRNLQYVKMMLYFLAIAEYSRKQLL